MNFCEIKINESTEFLKAVFAVPLRLANGGRRGC